MKDINNKMKKLYNKLYYGYKGIQMLPRYLKDANMQFGRSDIFCGWGLMSRHATPWTDNATNAHFIKATEKIKSFTFTDKKDSYSHNNIDTLLWRHWIISFVVRYAVELSSIKHFTMVECGVGFGWSAHFAMNELENYKKNGIIDGYDTHLYDVFKANKKYGNLSFDTAKDNLKEYADNITWHIGYLPDTLQIEPLPPETLSYLHVDLNMAQESIEICKYFLDKFSKRGIILFDDYGHRAHKELFVMVNDYFRDKKGVLLPLPTGQAIYLVN
jgi:Cu/Ag efflux protein CusF